jgi:hypothetical protein
MSKSKRTPALRLREMTTYSSRDEGSKFARFGALRLSTLSWCRRTGISAPSRALDRNRQRAWQQPENLSSATSITRFAAARQLDEVSVGTPGAIDFVRDQLATGCKLRVLTIVDMTR